MHNGCFSSIRNKIYKLIIMNKIEHIGIAVKDLATSIPLFEKLLNSTCYKTEEVASEKVMTCNCLP